MRGLKHEVMLLNCGRLAEEYIEGPHRCVKREVSRAFPSRLPWVSASLTLKTNIALYEEFCTSDANKEMFVCLSRQHRSILSSVTKDKNTIEDAFRAHMGIRFYIPATIESSWARVVLTHVCWVCVLVDIMVEAPQQKQVSLLPSPVMSSLTKYPR